MLYKLIIKYKSLSRPAKASLWFIGCYIIQRGIQFIGMPIYTRIMTSEEYGIYSVFLSWFNLICVFTSLSIYNGTFNKAMVKYEEKRDSYISSIQYLTFAVSVLLSVVFVIFHYQIESWTGYGLKFILLLCVHLILYPSLQYWSQKQRFLFAYKGLVAVTLINSLASIGLGVAFVLLSDDKGFTLVAVTVAVQAIINIILFCSLAKNGKTVYNKEYWHWTTVTAIPLIPHYLSEILLGHADRLMINQLCGLGQAGIYNIVYQISMVMTILRTGINGAFTPWLYYSLKKKRYLDIRRVTKLITILMWSLTVLFMLVGPEILKFVAPPTYYEAIIDIPAIMIGCYFIFVYVLFLNIEIYFEQNQYVAVASVVSAILNVILNYICISAFGYLAAGYTTMISYMTMAIFHYLFLKKIIHNNEELKVVFDFKFIFMSSIALVIVGVALLKVYEILFLRTGIIICTFGLFVWKRDVVRDLLTTLKKKN